MRYLVAGSEGPGFSSPEEAVHVLEKTVLPSFDALIELEKGKKSLREDFRLGIGFLFSSWKHLPTRR